MNKKEIEEIRERMSKKKFKVRKNAWLKEPKPISKKDKLVQGILRGEIEA